MDLPELRRLIDGHTADLDRAAFWRMVEASKVSGADPEDACDEQIGRLRHLLIQLRPAAIVQFDRIWWAYNCLAYSEALWAAAYILNEGCSSDGFIDFRQWLIGQGEAVYRAALDDPDTLVDAVGPPPGTHRSGRYMCEHLWHVARDAYLEQAETRALALPEDERVRVDFPRLETGPLPLRGEPWEERDLPRRLPRLWAVFGWTLDEGRQPTP
jgi:hypothetical protein